MHVRPKIGEYFPDMDENICNVRKLFNIHQDCIVQYAVNLVEATASVIQSCSTRGRFPQPVFGSFWLAHKSKKVFSRRVRKLECIPLLEQETR